MFIAAIWSGSEENHIKLVVEADREVDWEIDYLFCMELDAVDGTP
jgi:hypothetical protein